MSSTLRDGKVGSVCKNLCKNEPNLRWSAVEILSLARLQRTKIIADTRNRKPGHLLQRHSCVLGQVIVRVSFMSIRGDGLSTGAIAVQLFSGTSFRRFRRTR
jgi:hypothetical protein